MNIGTTIHDELVSVEPASLGRYRITLDGRTITQLDGTRFFPTEALAVAASLTLVPSHRRA